MKSLRNFMSYTLEMLIFSFILILSFYVEAGGAHGVLMVVKGEVTVLSSKDKKIVKAKIGTQVFPGDTIETKKDARAKLVMVDKNIINISPDSKFLLEKYEYAGNENKKSAILNVIYGKVRATVVQKYDGEQNRFQVKTKSSVAGVRGTDFMVSFSDTTSTAKVVTFEGRVEVGQGLDASGRIQNPVFVTPGQFTVANLNSQPAIPIAMPADELKSLNQQTVADKPDFSTQGDGRSPSNAPEGNSNAPNDSSNGDSGSNVLPQNGAGSPHAPNVLDEMGEDIAAPANGSTFTPPVTNLLPPPGSQPAAGCPNGQCVPLNTIDPSLINGKTKVLININPQ